jgi:hypothetical protein
MKKLIAMTLLGMILAVGMGCSGSSTTSKPAATTPPK